MHAGQNVGLLSFESRIETIDAEHGGNSLTTMAAIDHLVTVVCPPLHLMS